MISFPDVNSLPADDRRARHHPLARHRTLAAVGVACAIAALATDLTATPPQQDEVVELWLLTSRHEGAIARGARMGADEMGRTTSLRGKRFVLREVQTSTADGAQRAVAALKRGRQTTFVVLDLDSPAACEVAASLAQEPKAIVVYPRIADGSCARAWLQLRLPAAARSAVLARATADDRDVATRRVDEWHPTLGRFGAGELNDRYRRRTRAAMDGDAWAGWFAARMAADASLRFERPTPALLRGPTAPAFDGCKGVPLRFDGSGVLQQPVYVVDSGPPGSGRILKEVR